MGDRFRDRLPGRLWVARPTINATARQRPYQVGRWRARLALKGLQNWTIVERIHSEQRFVESLLLDRRFFQWYLSIALAN
jgi:hypothetical protein